MTVIRMRSAIYVTGLMVALLSFQCANQQEPQGGPIDSIPPEIIYTEPDSNALHVNGARIVLEFDEYVDQRSVEESIFISPALGGMEFDWSGTRVTISFEDSLRPNTTYVMNLGTDVVDRRNRNRMAEAFVLAFSTGDRIDRGSISGQVLARSPGDALSGVMVFAYGLDGANADTLDPRIARPAYATQTGSEGQFLFRHLAFGSYRIIAVRDEFRNLLYDQESDDYGVPTRDVTLNEQDTLASGLILQLSREDTTAPRLIRVDALDRAHVGIQFSEALTLDGLTTESFEIRDTLSGAPLMVKSVYATSPSLNSFVLLTGSQDSTLTYRLIATGVRDSMGNRSIPPTNALRFTGSGAPDTLVNRLQSISIKDSSVNVPLLPDIRIAFADVIARPVPAGFVTLSHTDTIPLTIRTEWTDGRTLNVVPLGPLSGDTWFRLTVQLDSLRDWSGDSLADSARVLSFKTVDPENFGSIEGTVEGWSPANPQARLFVAIKRVDQKSAEARVVRANAAGRFSFDLLEGGRYVLRPHEDANGDGRYDGGLPFPFRPSERVGPASDTLRVRSRWPLDGVTLKMQ